MRYRAGYELIEGNQVVALYDDETNSKAVMIPSIGFNMISCRLQGQETLAGPPELKRLSAHTAEYGVPLLCPPSRIRRGQFTYLHRSYQFPLNDNTNHLHGEIRRLPWRVTFLSESNNEGAQAVAELHLGNAPEIAAYYPHDVVLQLTYRLIDGCIFGALEALNQGDFKAPFGFGIHAYFLLQDEDQEEAQIIAPAEYQYDTWSEGGFISRMPEKTELCNKLTSGMPLKEMPAETDHLLLRLADGQRSFQVLQKRSGTRIVFQCSDSFPFLAVFQPKWTNAISLEPWSCITDAFNAPLGPEWTGAAGISNGSTVSFHWQWHIEPLLQNS